MSLVMKQRQLSSRWRDLYGAQAPTTNPHWRSRHSTNDEIGGEGVCPEWFAQRIWEDDGGRVVGVERGCAA